MQTFKALTLAAAGMLMAGAATAVTVKNASKSDVTIGIDWGHQEKVETVPAAKSVFRVQGGLRRDRPLGLLPDGLRHR
jgi:uncharacterized protein YabE (DUF348 family)